CPISARSSALTPTGRRSPAGPGSFRKTSTSVTPGSSGTSCCTDGVHQRQTQRAAEMAALFLWCACRAISVVPPASRAAGVVAAPGAADAPRAVAQRAVAEEAAPPASVAVVAAPAVEEVALAVAAAAAAPDVAAAGEAAERAAAPAAVATAALPAAGL